MKTRMKGKGKAIVGIAMAAIMLASVFAAMVPTASAAIPPDTLNNGDNAYINCSEAGTYKVIIGETLNFSEINKPIVGLTPEDIEGRVFGSTATDYDTASYFTIEGVYNVTGAIALVKLSVEKPRAALELKATSAGVTKKVDRITQGTPLLTDFTTNLFGNDIVDLVITGPSGRMHSDAPYRPADPQSFDTLNITWLKENYGTAGINTTNWKVGTYTFQIKTKAEKARGLDAETTTETLTIGKPDVDIKADKTSVVELAIVKLTVTGKVDDTIRISGPKGNTHVIFPLDADDNKIYNTTTGKMNTTVIDADGTKIFAVKFDETGSYTITVTDINTSATDTVDITVTEMGVTFDLPITVVIGDKFTMKGTANTGTTVDIFVDGKLWTKLDDLVIEDGEFSEEVTADDKIGMSVPGSVRLKAWIDGKTDTPTTPADGDTAVLLVEPGLTAEITVETVAQEDSFYVKGTAKGAISVDVLTVSPKGASGKGMEPTSVIAYDYPGLTYKNPSVSDIDDSFSKKITVDEKAGTGSYLVAVSYKGRDGHYGATHGNDDSLIKALTVDYGSLAGKTQEQILAMLVDITTGAGSDDLIWIGKIKVEAAKVTLDTIADVAIGEPLAVAGTTNREEGHTMLITVKGPVELTPEIALVENGTFSATFDTTDAVVGTYTVKAADGDGHTDDATVEILAEVPVVIPTATPAPTAEPTEAPVPTAEPTEEPTPTPTEEPGFEAVFAIAGLLSIAYLVLRRRK